MFRTHLVERIAPFRQWLPSDVFVVAKAALLAVVAVQAARLLWAIVTPVGPYNDWRPALPQALPAQVQSTLLASVDPFFRSNVAASGQAVAVDLQLFGIRGGLGTVPAAAILGTADGEQKSYLVGEEVAPGIRLTAVHFDHVVVSRGPAQQSIFMQGAESDAATAAVATNSGNAAASAAAPAAGQAFSMTPRTQGSRVTGIQIAPGSNAALFASAGFRQGDVVVAVNGARITSMIDVQQLQSSIAPGARLMLTVERGAQAVPIALNVPGNP